MDPAVRKEFETMMETMKAGILEEMNKALNKKFAEQNATIATLTKRVESNENKIKKLETNERKANEKIEELTNENESYRRRCNILINGVPYSADEKLDQIYAVLSRKLGFDTPPPVTRLFRYKGKEPGKCPIAIHFVLEKDKIAFKSSYAKVRTEMKVSKIPELAVGAAGCSLDSIADQIFIQDDLSTAMYKLFRSALAKKKAKIFNQVIVKDSKVFVKISADGKLFPAFTSFAFNRLVASAKSTGS